MCLSHFFSGGFYQYYFSIKGIAICMMIRHNTARRFSQPDLNLLANSASFEQYQRFHSIGNDLESGRNSTDVDGTADIIDLVSLHEINNIQSALDCALNAVCSQTWSVTRGPTTSMVLQLLHQLSAVNGLILDLIHAKIDERCHTWSTCGSGLICPPVAVISFNTAIEAACGDLTFLIDIVACCLSSSLSLIDAAEAHAAADRPDLVAASLDDLACITAQLGLSSLSAAAAAAHAACGSGASALLQIPVLRAALAATEAEWAAMDVEPSQPCPVGTLPMQAAADLR
mmetsp:Transcript_60818/g.127454  ORF Transcript_60818/g.127454 Transcript_60818/m.127454 type:complete len:286 (-) Transcript_60818:222-1079(-)